MGLLEGVGWALVVVCSGLLPLPLELLKVLPVLLVDLLAVFEVVLLWVVLALRVVLAAAQTEVSNWLLLGLRILLNPSI